MVIYDEIAISFSSPKEPMPIGPLRVMKRGSLASNPRCSELMQFNYAFKILGLRDAPPSEALELVDNWAHLIKVAYGEKSNEVFSRQVNALINQFMLPRINKYARPLTQFRADLDNPNLYGWFLDLDTIEDLLLDEATCFSFLMEPSMEDSSYAHIIQHEGRTYLLRQSVSYDMTQGHVDLMDIHDPHFVWQVNENLMVELGDYLDAASVNNVLGSKGSPAAIVVLRKPVPVKSGIIPCNLKK